MRRAALLFLIAVPLFARTRVVRSAEAPATWLRAHAVSDIGTLVGDARVVALGDATHGTHETYAAKAAFTPELVANGFRTIAFEAPYAEFAKLDAYVVDGTGDPRALLALSRYWFWDTNEILDIIEWARAQNASGLTPPIHIAGVDPTEPVTAAAVVIAFLRTVDPAAAESAERDYGCLHKSGGGSDRCRAMVESVRALVAPYANDEILHAARVVEQGQRVLARGTTARDEAMAENILWLAGETNKVIVFGHNEHWGRTDYRLVDPVLVRSAGAAIADALGDAYFVIGSTILDGTFLAIEYTPDLHGTIHAQIMTAPSPDDYAVLFAQANVDSMLIPMRVPLPAWLSGTHRMRIAGSGVLSRDQATLDLPADFSAKYDAVLYIRRSTPTALRHWPEF